MDVSDKSIDLLERLRAADGVEHSEDELAALCREAANEIELLRQTVEAMQTGAIGMSEQPVCSNCDSTGWVCENHSDRPWDLTSNRADACGCGAGAPCYSCNPPASEPMIGEAVNVG